MFCFWFSRANFAAAKKTNISATSTGAALLASLVLLWGLSLESYELGRHFKTALGRDWSLISLFGIAFLWNAVALILLRVGLNFRLPAFRVAAYNGLILATSTLLCCALGATRIGWMPVLNARFGAFVFRRLRAGNEQRLERQKQKRALRMGTVERCSFGLGGSCVIVCGASRRKRTELVFIFAQCSADIGDAGRK